MKIVVMLIISIVAGLLSTMNFWVDDLDDARFHLNDVYMIALMTSWMILFMSVYMYYTNDHAEHKSDNITSITTTLISVGVIIYLIRQQIFIDDKQFIKGMIPHHSMAITMAKKLRDRTKNQVLKKLADDIIRTQCSEISLMKQIEKQLDK